jgi:hypothetical protein
VISRLPSPEVDLEAFLKGLDAEAKNHPKTWDPLQQKGRFFIDSKAAFSRYSAKSRCVIS